MNTQEESVSQLYFRSYDPPLNANEIEIVYNVDKDESERNKDAT